MGYAQTAGGENWGGKGTTTLAQREDLRRKKTAEGETMKKNLGPGTAESWRFIGCRGPAALAKRGG